MQIKEENPAALAVHCHAHCLNHCLQDVGRTITLLQDALDIVKEISKLTLFFLLSGPIYLIKADTVF